MIPYLRNSHISAGGTVALVCRDQARLLLLLQAEGGPHSLLQNGACLDDRDSRGLLAHGAHGRLNASRVPCSLTAGGGCTISSGMGWKCLDIGERVGEDVGED